MTVGDGDVGLDPICGRSYDSVVKYKEDLVTNIIR